MPAKAESIRFCKLSATARATNSNVDALPPDPSTSEQVGASIGKSIGGSIAARREFKICMEKLGYVRLDQD